MTKKPTRRYRNHREWRGLVAEYEAGHERPREFCRRHGLSHSAFYRWCKEFRDELCAGDTTTGDDSVGPLIELPGLAVHSAAPPPSGSDWRVELDLGGGLVLRLR